MPQTQNSSVEAYVGIQLWKMYTTAFGLCWIKCIGGRNESCILAWFPCLNYPFMFMQMPQMWKQNVWNSRRFACRMSSQNCCFWLWGSTCYVKFTNRQLPHVQLSVWAHWLTVLGPAPPPRAGLPLAHLKLVTPSSPSLLMFPETGVISSLSCLLWSAGSSRYGLPVSSQSAGCLAACSTELPSGLRGDDYSECLYEDVVKISVLPNKWVCQLALAAERDCLSSWGVRRSRTALPIMRTSEKV